MVRCVATRPHRLVIKPPDEANRYTLQMKTALRSQGSRADRAWSSAGSIDALGGLIISDGAILETFMTRNIRVGISQFPAGR
jgi:hypothetical protein